MTIASEITRLQNDKAAICTAIENKWVTVWAVTLDDYASCIDAIEQGWGGEWTEYIVAEYLIVWGWWGGGATWNVSSCHRWWWWGGAWGLICGKWTIWSWWVIIWVKWCGGCKLTAPYSLHWQSGCATIFTWNFDCNNIKIAHGWGGGWSNLTQDSWYLWTYWCPWGSGWWWAWLQLGWGQWGAVCVWEWNWWGGVCASSVSCNCRWWGAWWWGAIRPWCSTGMCLCGSKWWEWLVSNISWSNQCYAWWGGWWWAGSCNW
jgi:hypothetical protein